MASSFKLGSILNAQSLSQAKDTHKVSYIKLENIFPNPHNEEIYSTDGIELLSYSIEDKGLLQPLVVRPLKKNESSDREIYEVISGHRRRLAILNLMERKSPKAGDFNYVPCIIRSVKDENIKVDENFTVNNEELLDGNLFNRNKSDAEIAKEIAAKKAILEERKRRGDMAAVRILDLIAKEMGISLHQAKKFNSINQNASDDVKEAFNSGKISTETAYQLSKADTDTQNKIMEENADASEPLTAKNVKAAVDSAKEKKTKKKESRSSESKGSVTSPATSADETFSGFADTADKENDFDNFSGASPAETRLAVVSKLAALMKKFGESSEQVSFNEAEITHARAVLNSAYQYISKLS